MKSILDKEFKYVPAAATDLRKTFARIRREMCKRKVIPIIPLRKTNERR